MNNKGKMFCDICRRHNQSGSFSVGNTNLNPETMEAKKERLKQSLRGYKVVFQASKFQTSLAWKLLIQLIRCQTLLFTETPFRYKCEMNCLT